jgi:hypothetical protein
MDLSGPPQVYVAAIAWTIKERAPTTRLNGPVGPCATGKSPRRRAPAKSSRPPSGLATTRRVCPQRSAPPHPTPPAIGGRPPRTVRAPSAPGSAGGSPRHSTNHPNPKRRTARSKNPRPEAGAENALSTSAPCSSRRLWFKVHPAPASRPATRRRTPSSPTTAFAPLERRCEPFGTCGFQKVAKILRWNRARTPDIYEQACATTREARPPRTRHAHALAFDA